MAESSNTRPTLFILAREQEVQECSIVTAEKLRADVHPFTNATELIRHEEWPSPCCIVIESPVAGECACNILKQLTRKVYTPPVVILSKKKDFQFAVEVMELGALTVVHVDSETMSQQLLEKCALAIELDSQTAELLKNHQNIEHILSCLSERQRHVLDCIAHGKPTRTIAQDLGVSVRLIEHERSTILRKFNAASTPDVTLKIGEFRILETIKGGCIPKNHLTFRNSATRNGSSGSDNP